MMLRHSRGSGASALELTICGQPSHDVVDRQGEENLGLSAFGPTPQSRSPKRCRSQKASKVPDQTAMRSSLIGSDAKICWVSEPTSRALCKQAAMKNTNMPAGMEPVSETKPAQAWCDTLQASK